MTHHIEISADNDGSASIAGIALGAPAPLELIRIDGAPFAGKTSLARRLATRLGGILVSTDDHLMDLSRRGRTYPELVDRERLLEHVNALKSRGLLPILEGIWLEAVAAPSQFKTGLRVVVLFRPRRSDMTKDLTRMRRQFKLSTYERQYRPLDLADIVATRTFDPW